ncbi:hypothetical protein BO94DRAFT_589056 [Aspergillus sclerotioniger CBS 115572]|uniref:BZIP domain-containing protein n=1 Tax=Aspergillus sclerotioniger CBS 115572 TaxID=1450535 RepID=A0A317VLJ9_9EURO|nr:hypothetical protein BO94DRAFT_589056 [Aspergillus sclerotioniger CBS 115572]PWY75244.1 hypothetical protein BO94DRAFT_589056 [Aspergillus sclerotioniger CBS 115572]
MSETRRSQIRRAQKTHRQKKEANVQKALTRVAELEHRISRIGDLLQAYKVTLQSTLKDTYPELVEELDSVLAFLPAAPVEVMRASSCDGLSSRETEASVPRPLDHKQCTDPQAMVTQQLPISDASPQNNVTCSREAGQNSPHPAPDLHTHVEVQTVCRTIAAHVPYSYSYLESSFTRRLKRCSLEHAFRVFIDQHSNPLEVFRIFRLVPCFRERAKMYPYFEKLVTSSLGDSLEISALPFYSVGGAGTHYPVLDEAGNPIYPPGARVPRRILGILPMSDACEDPQSVDQSRSQRHLELCGFGGEWFDCRDVEGYLRARGVDLDGSSVFPVVSGGTYGCSNEFHDINKSQSDRISHAGFDISPSLQSSVYVFDLESFVTRLLRGMAILGRAPGFRRPNVEDAFQSALLKRA